MKKPSRADLLNEAAAVFVFARLSEEQQREALRLLRQVVEAKRASSPKPDQVETARRLGVEVTTFSAN